MEISLVEHTDAVKILGIEYSSTVVQIPTYVAKNVRRILTEKGES